MAEDKKLTKDELKNVSKNMRVINHVEIAVGDIYKLTAKDKEDESLMTKIDRAVELGVLERGK